MMEAIIESQLDGASSSMIPFSKLEKLGFDMATLTEEVAHYAAMSAESRRYEVEVGPGYFTFKRP